MVSPLPIVNWVQHLQARPKGLTWHLTQQNGQGLDHSIVHKKKSHKLGPHKYNSSILQVLYEREKSRLGGSVQTGAQMVCLFFSAEEKS